MTDSGSQATTVIYPPSRELFEYQREGVRFLLDNFNACIWDEPGLGKTSQAIVAAKQNGGPILIICPNSLKRWWRTEITTLYPRDHDKILMAGVGGRISVRSLGTRYDASIHRVYNKTKLKFPRWVICHYAGIRISQESYALIPWRTVILDEAHYIKNRKTARSKAVHQVTPTYACRYALTATPFSNNPADIWNQFRWIAPKVKGLRSYWRFFGIFVDSVWIDDPATGRRYRKVLGGKNLEILSEVMSHYGLQRTKREVAPHLPPLIETRLPLGLNGRQKDIYKAINDKNRVELPIRHTDGSGRISAVIIRNVLSRIMKSERWLSCPWTMDPGVEGAKMEWLKQWVEGYNKPAVIVTRFKKTAAYIQYILQDQTGWRPITGDIPVSIRNDIVQEWQKPGGPQFLVGTIHTLGTGLNLQRAHTLICYDQVHNTILMDQVRQRTHRITTDHPVDVIYLYIEKTTNELIMDAFTKKMKQMELVKEYLRRLREGKA